MNTDTAAEVLPRDAIAGFSPLGTAEAVAPPSATPSPMVGRTDRTHALRCREYRRRRREGLRVLPPMEIRETEIGTMIARGLLQAEHRGDQRAVIAAVYGVLDTAFQDLEAGAVPVEIQEHELDLLVRLNLLKRAEATDRYAIAAALYGLLDKVVPAIEDGTIEL